MDIKTWKPHKRQEYFLSLPDSIFEALYGGAAGGGKTDLLMMLPVVRGFHQHPRFKGIIFRRTYPELESEVINRSRNWYPHFGGVYNEDKKRWTFPSGAVMRFGHAEYESDVRKYDSDEYNYMAFDELTSFTEFQYKYITKSRCRSSTSSLPAIVRSGTNPGNIGHAWVRDYFIENIPAGTIVQDKLTTLKRIFVQSFLQDNPYLMENDPNYINRLKGLPEADRRAKLDGDWYTFEGQVFADYREQKMSDEPDNAVHLCAPFPIPDWWLRFLAIDWGYEAMTYALWGALSPDDKLYLYREYSVKRAKVSEWATRIGQLCGEEQYVQVVMCPSAWQNRGDDITIQEKFEKFSGKRAERAENGRIEGKLAVQEYLRWKPLDIQPSKPIEEFSVEHANRILRNLGEDSYNHYIDAFQAPKVESSIPRLQIFPDCLELRKTIPLCIYDKKSNVTNKLSEDVREFEGDDPYDTFRYMVCAVDRYLGTQSAKSQARNKISEVVAGLEKTKDWTTYHMRMMALESQTKERPKVVKRYHRGYVAH